MQYDVFISYSRKDYVDDKKNIIPNNVVSKIKDTLSKEGISYWFDEDGMSKDEILENDKSMRNHGYMKGPASCILQKDGEKSMRASDMAIRKIVGTFKIDKGDHWLRFKNVTGSGNKDREFNQDYLELVPTSVISNPAKPEDQN